VEASAKYQVKQHLRGIVLAGKPASPATGSALLAQGLPPAAIGVHRDERKFADKKVDVLVQGEVFGEAVAKLLSEK